MINYHLLALWFMLNSVLNLPTPATINYAWNFGSLLGLSLMTQIVTGFFLSFHYSPETLVFEKILNLSNEISYGWMMRFTHSTGASMFFIVCYLHVGKALIYKSYYYTKVWISGLVILLLIMGTAFLGYVLPWGQMSLWGATVITNLISVVPYVGKNLVEWLWGGFNVGVFTLNRFYSLHFILPFIITMMVAVHIIFLHSTGSSNPLGLPLNIDKITFFNYFVIKDLVTIVVLLTTLFFFSLYKPYLLMDHENFIMANPMITPPHIQPEWYFLFAYAILRSVPNKIGGVILLIFSLFIILVLPIISMSMTKSCRFSFFNTLVFWFHVGTFMILTWLGSMPVEAPFVELSKFYTFLYFLFYFIYPLI